MISSFEGISTVNKMTWLALNGATTSHYALLLNQVAFEVSLSDALLLSRRRASDWQSLFVVEFVVPKGESVTTIPSAVLQVLEMIYVFLEF